MTSLSKRKEILIDEINNIVIEGKINSRSLFSIIKRVVKARSVNLSYITKAVNFLYKNNKKITNKAISDYIRSHKNKTYHVPEGSFSDNEDNDFVNNLNNDQYFDFDENDLNTVRILGKQNDEEDMILEFTNDEYQELIEEELLNENINNQTNIPKDKQYVSINSAMKAYFKSYEINIKDNKEFFNTIFYSHNDIFNTILNKFINKDCVKFNITALMTFIKPKTGVKSNLTHFTSKLKYGMVFNKEEINEKLNIVYKILINKIEEFIENGSDWKYDETNRLIINISKFNPLEGSSYIPTPRSLFYNKNSGLINIQNNDQMCFKYSILCALNKPKNNPQRVSKYTKPEYLNLLIDKGIEYPIKLNDIKKIEKWNNLKINVFGYQNNKFIIYYNNLKISNYKKEIDLLLLEEEDKRHYILISDFNSLMSKYNKDKTKKYFCKRCLHVFSNMKSLNNHKERCNNETCQTYKLPSATKINKKTGLKENILKFTNYERKLKVPFVIYADFESALIKIYRCMLNDENFNKYTEKLQKHEAISYCYYIKCINEKYSSKEPIIYIGEDAAEHFLNSLLKEQKKIYRLLHGRKRLIEPLKLTKEEEQQFKDSKKCHICNKKYNKDDIKVRDHCHLTGVFRGAAHKDCNLNHRYPKHIPVVLHNLKGYDSHLILNKFRKIEKEYYDKKKQKKVKKIIEPEVIPCNKEKYLSFTIDKLRFIDSNQFLAGSLDTHVKNLEDSKKYITKKYFNNEEQFQLVNKKGIFCYDYIDSIEKLYETKLPSIENFYNKLTKTSVSKRDYGRANKIWHVFNCKTLKDYHNIYLIGDVLLLADVFENFRDTCLNYNHLGLDPCYYFSLPGFSWDCALKFSKIELELLTDIDIYNFIESGIRGGISMITKRFSEANNKYIKNNKKLNNFKKIFITYLDANNLYGWAMINSLPISGFKWLTDKNIDSFNENIKLTQEDIIKKRLLINGKYVSFSNSSKIGYIFEVDLEYPKELHDIHNDYPLAPERMEINKVEKLVPNFRKKSKYIVHGRNLALYLQLGLKLKKIHRVIQFNQQKWMGSYIMKNTECRAKAKNDFEKDFFKLMNNSVFGKTMENVKNRINYQLKSDLKKAKKLVNKINCKNVDIISEDLVGIEMEKTTVTLNKPIYCGFSILELSKTLMYDFHYNHIKKKYGDKAKLLFTDTDSLCYEIESEDFYKDIISDIDLFDTSNFPKDHFLFSEENKKVIGKMKMEEAEIGIIREFVGLRPKMYSLDISNEYALKIEEDKLKYLINNNVEQEKIDESIEKIEKYKKSNYYEKKTAKGVKKCEIKNITHEKYKKCLFDEENTYVTMNNIRSFKHNIYTIEQKKTALSYDDDKRIRKENKIETYAIGHKDIRD